MKFSKTEILLSELCGKLGFCLPPKEIARLRESPPESVDEFTDAVFLAEGVDLEQSRELRRQVRDIVAKHFHRWEESVAGETEEW